MARTTREKKQAANEIAERLSNRDPDRIEWRDADPLRHIADAFQRLVAAEAEVADAVAQAREKGYSWASIAAMLGVSKQTAQHRYGHQEAR